MGGGGTEGVSERRPPRDGREGGHGPSAAAAVRLDGYAGGKREREKEEPQGREARGAGPQVPWRRRKDRQPGAVRRSLRRRIAPSVAASAQLNARGERGVRCEIFARCSHRPPPLCRPSCRRGTRARRPSPPGPSPSPQPNPRPCSFRPRTFGSAEQHGTGGGHCRRELSQRGKASPGGPRGALRSSSATRTTKSRRPAT